ncbi:hypothetical protein NQD34_007430 [Periophthalmus magnuspinnatus]|nr:hypothetical protein NQD34_007430 [Periophthalmus magnuspinnatus]
MEDDVSKKGALFLQQQRFGKRWRKMWCVLFRESHCSVSRLEIYDWNERTDKSIRRHQDSKKVSDCPDAVDVDDSAPKDTSAFLLETTEKIFVFAADRLQADEWTQRLCEIAFPMNWTGPGLQRGSSQRNTRSEPNLNQVQGATAGMEDNSLYSQRETGTFSRQTTIMPLEILDCCPVRLKGQAVLKADADALILIDRCGQVLFSWPYRYLRLFGRDKSSFSFEAGRRCDSGEGSFEFDTKVGNALFAAVETAINRQRMSLPHSPASTGLDGPPPVSRPQRQTSLGLDSHPPISRSLPPRPVDPDPVYSLVNDTTLQSTHKDRESSSPSLRHHLCRLEPPVDKTLTAVKSLTLENRDLPVHRKNQVKMISSCPLPGDSTPSAPGPTLATPGPASTYSQVPAKGKKRNKTEGPNGSVTRHSLESEYSQPFDLVIPDLRDLGGAESERPLGADPLYDSIDEFQIRTIFHSDRTDHIYDEPEGCQSKDPAKKASVVAAASLYDEPEEIRVEAWRIMGTEQDPKGHEFPYNPRADDYAVPKRVQRPFPDLQEGLDLDPGKNRGSAQDSDQEQDLDQKQEEKGPKEEQGPGTNKKYSPHNNLPVKTEEQ